MPETKQPVRLAGSILNRTCHDCACSNSREEEYAVFSNRPIWAGRAQESAIDPKLIAEGAPAEKRLLTGYLAAEDAGKLVSVPGVNDHYHYTPSLTAIMVMTTIMMDERLSPKAAEALDTLMAFTPPAWNPRDQKTWKLADYYYWYYGTYALFQATPDAADSRWKRWNEAMKAALLDTQNLRDSKGTCKEGSWDPVDRWSSEGGRIYSTAMAALTLEVYYRYPRVLALKKPERMLKVDVQR